MAGERATTTLRWSRVVLYLSEEGEPVERRRLGEGEGDDDEEDDGDADLREEGLRVVRLADWTAAATRFVRLAGEVRGEEVFLRAR